MAIEGEMFGSCVEEIRIEVGGRKLRLNLVCLEILCLQVERLGASVFRLR